MPETYQEKFVLNNFQDKEYCIFPSIDKENIFYLRKVMIKFNLNKKFPKINEIYIEENGSISTKCV